MATLRDDYIERPPQMNPFMCMSATLGLLLPIGLAATAAEAVVLRAEAFGVKGDGVSDDGPAIQRMLDAAVATDSPVRLEFRPKGTIRIESAPDRYAFRFHGASHVTLDGGGSTFLLGPRVRFLRLTHSSHVTVRNLNIDFDPLPFVDGTISAASAAERYVDVRLSSDAQEPPIGGPTKEDGEQAFFAMLWYDGAYGLLSRHYWTERIEPGLRPKTVRVFATDRFRQFGDIEPGKWRISLPVPGIAHRYGPGACMDIRDNDTVTVKDVELWSAPWFGFHVIRNRGEVAFRRVHIRPRPGSGRLTSTWRDGFHVKGNRGKLLWEDCVLSGMNDDAFNISTHCSRVRKMISPTELVVLQAFPLNPMPWHEGATFTAADFDSRTLLGTARIVNVTGWTTKRRINGKPAASPVTLQIDRPIEGLKRGTMVWEPESANPDTTLRRCRIEKSCRLQTPVTLEQCEVTAFLWFNAMRPEGPYPSNIVIRECSLRRGRGNPRLAVSFAGRRPGRTGPSAIHDFVMERNRIWGDFSMIGVDRARIKDNQFCEPGAAIRIEGCTSVETKGNRDAQGQR